MGAADARHRLSVVLSFVIRAMLLQTSYMRTGAPAQKAGGKAQMSVLIGLALTVAVVVLYGTWHFSGNETAALVGSATDAAVNRSETHASAVGAGTQTGTAAYSGVDPESTALTDQDSAPAESNSTGTAPSNSSTVATATQEATAQDTVSRIAPPPSPSLAAVPSRKDISAPQKPRAFSLSAADRAERASASGQARRDAAEDPRQDEPARYPSGQFSIAGRVLDEDGYPVPGIELVARAQHLFGVDATAFQPGTLPEYVVYTGPDGSFSFQGLADGDYVVQTIAMNRYLPAQASVRAGNAGVDLVVLEQARELLIYGWVATSDGSPLQYVSVTPQGQSDAVLAESDGNGSYRFMLPLKGKAKTYFVRFQHEQYKQVDLRLDPAEYDNADEVQLDAVLIPLGQLVTVSGRVIDSRGTPVAGETVRLNSARLKESYTGTTDQSGHFSITSVAASADYDVRIYPQGAYKKLHQQSLGVQGKSMRLDLVLESLAFGRITGQMIDLDGNPVPRFSLMLYSEDANESPVQVTGDALGYFALDQFPAGRLTFSTNSSPHFSIRGVTLPAGGEAFAELVLDWGRYLLQGQVTDSRGDPVSVVSVQLIQSVTDSYGVSSRATRRVAADSQGRFQFSQLGPGPHTVYIGKTQGFAKVRLEHDVPLDGNQVVVKLMEVSE